MLKWYVLVKMDMSNENKFFIEPEKLLSYHSGLYLIFYVRTQNEFWTLAIHRILDLEVFDDVFPNDHPFDEEEFIKNRFGLFFVRVYNYL